ncbi:MAG: ribose-phosphate pyrophosphokinase [Burkholderiales bacterium]|nr:ribose-phosphate pyrophosphokinase [Burkholderiales bacterium]
MLTRRHEPCSFEAVGTDELLALEAHNVAAFQNAFRIPTLNLEAHRAFDTALGETAGDGPLAVASPDPGGVKRAQLWRESLEQRLARPVGFAMVDKRRSGGVVTSSQLVAGEVTGMTVLLLDDLIASGETMKRAATALRQAGAREVIAFAAHGLFISPASEVLAGERRKSSTASSAGAGSAMASVWWFMAGRRESDSSIFGRAAGLRRRKRRGTRSRRRVAGGPPTSRGSRIPLFRWTSARGTALCARAQEWPASRWPVPPCPTVPLRCPTCSLPRRRSTTTTASKPGACARRCWAR